MGLIWGCAPGLALTLLFCLQDTGGISILTLQGLQICSPSIPGTPRQQIAPLSLLGIALALPIFTYLLIVLEGKAEIQKVNCESNTAAPRAQHSNQAIKQ